ncbi:MAG TPA: lipopolysaccharide biosynthesis protein [Stellaceae bacterium]|nr:lipopolysaccharide biosynthesis protein [Stellaceae bacterium]
MAGSGELPLRTRVARSIFWLAWSRGVAQLLSFATTVLVARILVPADFGVMALAGMFIATAGVLTEMGLGGAIVQFRDLGRRELDTCFWITVTLAAIGYAVLALGASVIADWFAVPRLAQVLPVLALGLPVNACTVVSGSLLRKRLALDQISQAEIIGAGVTLPVMLCCALAGLGVWTLVIGSLVGWVVRGAVIFAFAPWLPRLRIGGERAKDMLHFSLTTLGISLLWAIREQSDVAVIGKITGQVTVGLYSMAKDVAMLPTAKISSVVFMLSSPMMAELQTDIAAMRRAFFRAVRLTAAIALPASTGMALVADDTVAVLLGPKWLPAVPVLRLLCLYAAVRAVDVLLPPVLFARRRQRFLFWYFLALLLAVAAAAAFGALWGGAPGAVVFLTPVYCGLMVIMTKEALGELKGSFSELWFATRPILGATAAMATVVLLLRDITFARSPLVELILLSVTGAVTYLGALFALGRTVIGEGAEIVGWILRRHGLD